LVGGQIFRKPVSISASKIYDGNDNLASAVEIQTGVTGETLNYSGATGSNSHVASPYKYVAAITLASGDLGIATNYVLPLLDSVNAPLVIRPRTISGWAQIVGDYDKIYDNSLSVDRSKVSLVGQVTQGIPGDEFVLDFSAINVAYKTTQVGMTQIEASGLPGFNLISSNVQSARSDYLFVPPQIFNVDGRIKSAFTIPSIAALTSPAVSMAAPTQNVATSLFGSVSLPLQINSQRTFDGTPELKSPLSGSNSATAFQVLKSDPSEPIATSVTSAPVEKISVFPEANSALIDATVGSESPESTTQLVTDTSGSSKGSTMSRSGPNSSLIVVTARVDFDGNLTATGSINLAPVQIETGKIFEINTPLSSLSSTSTSDSMQLSATMEDGGALPAWLKFDPTTGKFSGQTPASNISIKVILNAVSATGSISSAVLALNVGAN